MKTDYLNERRLLYFFVAVSEGSIRQAADKLNVEASVVSRQIQMLERELAVQLLDRHGRGVTPTESGQLVYAHCKQRRSSEETLLADLDDLNGLQRGEIRFVAGEGFIEETMRWVLGEFCQRYPKIKVDFQIASAVDVVRRVAEEGVHIGLTMSPPDHPNVTVAATRRQPLCCIVWAGHPLTQCGTRVDLVDAIKYPVGLMSQGYGLRNIIQLAAFSDRLKIDPHFTTNSIVTLKHYVSSALGVTFLSKNAVEREVSDGVLVALPINNPVFEAAEAKLLVPSGRRLPSAARQLLLLLQGTSLFQPNRRAKK